MDNISGSIQAMLKQIFEQQLQYEKNGQYVEAQECRLKYEKQKDDHYNKRMSDMIFKHKKSQEDLLKARKNELDTFGNLCDKEMSQFVKQSQKMGQQLQKKHDTEIQNTKDQLDRTLPTKVKESSELLNLRKMEEHMAKQKNYNQAHKIQQKAAAYLKKQTQTWDLNRKTKMEAAINTLRGKQKVEMTNFEKRVATSKAQKNLERKRQEEKINLKYDNFMKDLKNANQKQVLAFKGQFKSLGGSATASSSPAKSRSSFGSNFGSSQ